MDLPEVSAAEQRVLEALARPWAAAIIRTKRHLPKNESSDAGCVRLLLWALRQSASAT